MPSMEELFAGSALVKAAAFGIAVGAVLTMVFEIQQAEAVSCRGRKPAHFVIDSNFVPFESGLTVDLYCGLDGKASYCVFQSADPQNSLLDSVAPDVGEERTPCGRGGAFTCYCKRGSSDYDANPSVAKTKQQQRQTTKLQTAN